MQITCHLHANYVCRLQTSKCWFHVLDMDFGRERVRFVAERNYRRRGPRFDSVEVYLAGEERHPAKILFFISRKKKTPMRASEIGVESLKGVYAMVQYYDVVTWEHPVVQQPRCRLSNSGIPPTIICSVWTASTPMPIWFPTSTTLKEFTCSGIA